MILPWPELNQPDVEYLRLAETVYADAEYGSPWQNQFLARCKKSNRTLRRWLDGERLPGPVRAMILAHAKCQRAGIEF
jgi:hypothetical protein